MVTERVLSQAIDEEPFSLGGKIGGAVFPEKPIANPIAKSKTS
jgi:hypothetical protein